MGLGVPLPAQGVDPKGVNLLNGDYLQPDVRAA